jgi:hypothetical protein
MYQCFKGPYCQTIHYHIPDDSNFKTTQFLLLGVTSNMNIKSSFTFHRWYRLVAIMREYLQFTAIVLSQHNGFNISLDISNYTSDILELWISVSHFLKTVEIYKNTFVTENHNVYSQQILWSLPNEGGWDRQKMVKKKEMKKTYKIHSKNLNRKNMWEILWILIKYLSGCGENLSC